MLTLILLSVTIHSLLASIPGELLGETKLSNVPGQGFGSSMLAVQGDTLVAKTNVYVRIGANWVVQDQLTPREFLSRLGIAHAHQLIADALTNSGYRVKSVLRNEGDPPLWIAVLGLVHRLPEGAGCLPSEGFLDGGDPSGPRRAKPPALKAARQMCNIYQ